ncbi:hypothetical protein [Kingella oralis]
MLLTSPNWVSGCLYATGQPENLFGRRYKFKPPYAMKRRCEAKPSRFQAALFFFNLKHLA